MDKCLKSSSQDFWVKKNGYVYMSVAVVKLFLEIIYSKVKRKQ